MTCARLAIPPLRIVASPTSWPTWTMCLVSVAVNIWLHQRLTTYLCPEEFRTFFANNGGGYQNHCFFWKSIGTGANKPSGALAEAIDATFGSFDEFKKQFSACAGTVFGSGWAWLYLDTTQSPAKLVIGPSFNQGTPANDAKKIPLLTLVRSSAPRIASWLFDEAVSCRMCGSMRTTSSTTRTAPRTSRRSGTS